MEFWARVGIVVALFVLIEGVDSAIDSVAIPWWLSLLMAAFCSIGDIIFIFAFEVIFGE